MAKLRGKSPKKAKTKKAKVLVFGEGGVGKTWWALDFPDCYYIDAEGGASRSQYIKKLDESGAMYLGQEDGAGDLETVVREVQTLATTKHDRKTLIIDSYTKLFMNAVAAEEERLVAAGEKLAFGNEKKPAVKLSRRLVTWMDRLDMNCILICHQKALWKQGEQIGDTFDGWDKLNYELDLTIQTIKTGSVRKGIVRKSRLDGFEDSSSFDWTYEEFARKYGREFIEGSVTSLKPSSADQVSRLQTLIHTFRLDEGTQAKWLDKAGVETWSEMDADTIQSCIEHLERKAIA